MTFFGQLDLAQLLRALEETADHIHMVCHSDCCSNLCYYTCFAHDLSRALALFPVHALAHGHARALFLSHDLDPDLDLILLA